MKYYIKSTLLALVVLAILVPIKAGAVVSSGATTLKSSNFSSTAVLTQATGVLSGVYTLKYKLKAVEYLGGKCALCGYSKCLASLDFHHINPLTKDTKTI